MERGNKGKDLGTHELGQEIHDMSSRRLVLQAPNENLLGTLVSVQAYVLRVSESISDRLTAQAARELYFLEPQCLLTPFTKHERNPH